MRFFLNIFRERERERERERDRKRGRRKRVWEQTKTNSVFTCTNVAPFFQRWLESITRCKEKSTHRERGKRLWVCKRVRSKEVRMEVTWTNQKVHWYFE